VSTGSALIVIVLVGSATTTGSSSRSHGNDTREPNSMGWPGTSIALPSWL